MATNQQVKLFGMVGSPFVTRAEIALKFKGVEYEYIQESVTNKSDHLLKYNPIHKKVPVLLHNEKPICESLVIVEYVDEAWTGHRILPSDPYTRAQARFWSRFIDDRVLPAVIKAAWNPDEKEREKGIEESALRILDKELKLKGKFFNGDSIGFVDIAVLIMVFWLPIIQETGGLNLYSGEKYPKLEKWGQEILCLFGELLPPKHAIQDKTISKSVKSISKSIKTILKSAKPSRNPQTPFFQWSSQTGTLTQPIGKGILPPKDHIFAVFKTRFQSITVSK